MLVAAAAAAGSSDASSASATAVALSSSATGQHAAAPHLARAEGANNILSLNEYRRGVGLCIYRPRDGLVFAARRVDDPTRSWQLPQGGIDPLENPMRAALRELHEETAITSVRIVASVRAPGWPPRTRLTAVRSAAVVGPLLPAWSPNPQR